jgi:UDP-N-acetylglucosamine--N-acetylmuramyl-(pentapeptide) pyrophosphoryl-undecaprenol N-acetylglucosamine transferase
MKKVIITGGHLTPALAVAAVLTKRNWDIVYIGQTHSVAGDAAFSQEYLNVTRLGHKFLPITAGKLHRRITRQNLASLVKIPFGLLQVFIYLTRERPQVILSFGGFIAVPVILGGWLLGIPIVMHEQTKAPGLANRFIQFFATYICVGWEETARTFPKHKTVVTGNPLRTEIFQKGTAMPVSLDKPLLYITGGTLGAHSLNLLVEPVVKGLLNWRWELVR